VIVQGGLLLLELHTADALRRMEEVLSIRQLSEQELFSPRPRPHISMRRAFKPTVTTRTGHCYASTSSCCRGFVLPWTEQASLTTLWRWPAASVRSECVLDAGSTGRATCG
jgi:hypothetical protein